MMIHIDIDIGGDDDDDDDDFDCRMDIPHTSSHFPPACFHHLLLQGNNRKVLEKTQVSLDQLPASSPTIVSG